MQMFIIYFFIIFWKKFQQSEWQHKCDNLIYYSNFGIKNISDQISR